MTTRTGTGTGTIAKDDTRLEKPRMYKVIIHNDDDTPMDFVVAVLQQIFHHPQEKAIQIMLAVHKSGKGIAGVYTHEVAEVKAHKANEAAKQHEFPLLTTTEPE